MIVLSIGGSDPSAGAGIQADLKTFSALGVYGLTVITAITSQNTTKFSKIQEIPPKMITSQLESVLSDFKIDIIKIGMVYSAPTIRAIYSQLKRIEIPIVLDPIFESTTRGKLIQTEAFALFKKLLVPLAFVITPNVLEAQRLAKMKIQESKDIKKAAAKIQKIGAKNIVIKGGHLRGNTATDFVFEGTKFYSYSAKKINRIIHGSGCNFSAALASSLAKTHNLRYSIRFAKDFTLRSITNSQKIGKGIHIAKMNEDKLERELSGAISKFINLEKIHKYIPEVQTNFVFSKKNPRSLDDILGVSGRIVKAGDGIVIAGTLSYGGSRHVGSAVLEMAKKFPDTRSAINIRYDKEFIKKAISRKFSVVHYERSLESHKTKMKEGHTISWGIKNAIRDATTPVDIVFHKGEIGKEPMILIFGTDPNKVLNKLITIVT